MLDYDIWFPINTCEVDRLLHYKCILVESLNSHFLFCTIIICNCGVYCDTVIHGYNLICCIVFPITSPPLFPNLLPLLTGVPSIYFSSWCIPIIRKSRILGALFLYAHNIIWCTSFLSPSLSKIRGTVFLFEDLTDTRSTHLLLTSICLGLALFCTGASSGLTDWALL